MICGTDAAAEGSEEFAAHAPFVAGKICRCRFALGQFGSRNQNFQRAGNGVETDDIAIADERDRAAIHRFRCDVDGGWHLAESNVHSIWYEMHSLIKEQFLI